ncbi:hypothetical protein [uncultured Croceitalea sp.]|uniref:hypothetical protein n=1 Tax=uncultured Croceitalea sp. TaxID=1798908 RepID=UPI003305EE2F
MYDNNGFNPQDFDNDKNLRSFVGLKQFRKTLERDFFADARVRVTNHLAKNAELVIELDCNFGLTESLFHLNNGNWGSFYASCPKEDTANPFQIALFQLSEENDCQFDIHELIINLRDTSLVITKIFDQSIPDQLGNILSSISENFVHFTKGLTEMPYEIFVPVFEEQNGAYPKSGRSTKKSKTDYFDFWGLYFESSCEGAIYDLKSKSVIDESDFFLLNQ